MKIDNPILSFKTNKRVSTCFNQMVMSQNDATFLYLTITWTHHYLRYASTIDRKDHQSSSTSI